MVPIGLFTIRTYLAILKCSLCLILTFKFECMTNSKENNTRTCLPCSSNVSRLPFRSIKFKPPPENEAELTYKKK